MIHSSQNIKFKTSIFMQNIPYCSLLPSNDRKFLNYRYHT